MRRHSSVLFPELCTLTSSLAPSLISRFDLQEDIYTLTLTYDEVTQQVNSAQKDCEQFGSLTGLKEDLTKRRQPTLSFGEKIHIRQSPFACRGS